MFERRRWISSTAVFLMEKTLENDGRIEKVIFDLI